MTAVISVQIRPRAKFEIFPNGSAWGYHASAEVWASSHGVQGECHVWVGSGSIGRITASDRGRLQVRYGGNRSPSAALHEGGFDSSAGQQRTGSGEKHYRSAVTGAPGRNTTGRADEHAARNVQQPSEVSDRTAAPEYRPLIAAPRTAECVRPPVLWRARTYMALRGRA